MFSVSDAQYQRYLNKQKSKEISEHSSAEEQDADLETEREKMEK